MSQVIDSNIRHRPVSVPSGRCPLGDQAFLVFQRGIKLLIDSGDVPSGYGASAEELGDDGFDDHQQITVGILAQSYAIELPSSVWAPRMRLWAQGLYVLDTILSMTRTG